MKEGWFGGDHFIIFDEGESLLATDEYGVSNYLDGFNVTGLVGWDSFILLSGDRLYTVPTVPIASEYLELMEAGKLPATLDKDENFLGKIKWYSKPVAFGGDPISDVNMVWVNHKQHRELVKFWNEQYQKIKL